MPLEFSSVAMSDSVCRVVSNRSQSQLQLSVLAKDYESLKAYLLCANIDINNRFFSLCLKTKEFVYGLSALHVSVIANDLKAAQLLLKSGADVNLKTGFPFRPKSRSDWYRIGISSIGHNHKRTYSALHLAVIYGFERMVRLLVSYRADLNIKDHSGRTPLELSLEIPYLPALLIQSGADCKSEHLDDFPLIFRAICLKNIVLIKRFAGLQTKCLYYCEQSPLEYAMNVFPDCVPTLISFGRQLHFANPYTGETALHLAVRKQNIQWIELLCRQNVDPNVANRDGRDGALHIGVQSNCSKELVEVLLSFGANPNQKNARNWTPICCAIANGNTVLTELLFQYDTRLSRNLIELEKGIRWRRPKTTLIVLNYCPPIDSALTFDFEPILWFFILHCVGDKDSDINDITDVFKKLLELNSDPNAVHPVWGTLMHVLIHATDCHPTECYIHLFRALIQSPYCDLNKPFVPKETILRTGQAVTVDMIAANGTALTFALQTNGCELFAEELIRMGADLQSIDWYYIFFAPKKVKALKMLALSACGPPDYFAHWADPRGDPSVAEEDIEFYAKEFKSLNDWMDRHRSQPMSLKNCSRLLIRKCLGVTGCRLLKSAGARALGPELETFPKLFAFIQFNCDEDFD